MPLSVARAARVLADSESTRRDIIELLGTPAGEGLRRLRRGRAAFPTGPRLELLRPVRERYHLPELFVLFVGTIEPRKNLSRLISAYSEMRRQTGLPHQLVLSGSKGWLYEDIFKEVTREGLEKDVQFLGFVADVDLPALYTLADLFVFPSLYEGFGLPPLEAMACGTPVIASNNSSLPEVLGDAARFVDAEDVTGLADAMATVLADGALRTRLAGLGRDRQRASRGKMRQSNSSRLTGRRGPEVDIR